MKCEVTDGPKYTPSGTLTPTDDDGTRSATFNLSAEFKQDPAGGFCATCCELRQYISSSTTLPQNGAYPANYKPGDWVEDRDTAGKRYGHRTGDYSEEIDIDKYTNSDGTNNLLCGTVYRQRYAHRPQNEEGMV